MNLQLSYYTNTEKLLRLHREIVISTVILKNGINETFN